MEGVFFAGQGACSILNLIRDATFPSWIRLMDSWVCCQFKVLPVGLCKSSQVLEACWLWLQLTFVTCRSFSLLWLDDEGGARGIGSLVLQWLYLIFVVAISHRSSYKQNNLMGHIGQYKIIWIAKSILVFLNCRDKLFRNTGHLLKKCGQRTKAMGTAPWVGKALYWSFWFCVTWGTNLHFKS